MSSSTSTASTSMGDPNSAVFVTMEMDAFILNPAVCEQSSVQIVPITQPNYAGLRIDGKSTSHDVLPRIDVSLSTGDASLNPRVNSSSSTSSPSATASRYNKTSIDSKRTGIHLSWRLPQCYRVGHSSSSTDKTQPRYPNIPTRWLVARTLSESTPSFLDIEGDTTLGARQLEIWVIDSNSLQNLEDISEDVDIEMSMSPIVSSHIEPHDTQLASQTQTYAGRRTPWNTWKDSSNPQDRFSMTNLTGSNPYFLDCAMHNINVLSFFDDLSYTDENGQLKYFEYVKCDYLVLGFHDSLDVDPLSGKQSVYQGPVKFDQDELKARLQDMGLNATDLDWMSLQKYADQLAQRDSEQIPCLTVHPLGKIHEVEFHAERRPTKNPAAKFAEGLTAKKDTEPISVGGTTLDAFMALIGANQQTGGIDNLGLDNETTVKVLRGLSDLLWATDGDDYDSRAQANDYTQGHIYRSIAGEDVWQLELKDRNSSNSTPVSNDLHTLAALCDQQRLHDAVLRQLKVVRWQLFSEFFRSITQCEQSSVMQQEAKTRVQKLRQKVKDLETTISGETGTLHKIKNLGDSLRVNNAKGLRKAAGPQFSQRKDPSICFAGLNLTGIATVENKAKAYTLSFLDDDNIGAYQGGDFYYSSMKAQDPKTGIGAFWHPDSTLINLLAQPTNNFDPFLTKEVPDEQAFVPLYVEWEVEYFHIPKHRWAVKLHNRTGGAHASDSMNATTAHGREKTSHNHLHYYVKDTLTETSDPIDARRFVGRSALMPQTGFSLRNLVKQILDRSGTEDNSTTELLSHIDRLPFASATLGGFTTHLLTRGSGTHIKPNYRDDNENFQQLGSALAAGVAIGLNEDDLKSICDQSAQTPYGDLVEFESDGPVPFKGVTHGQFVIRRLDVVDKFGQVVTAPVPYLNNDTAHTTKDHIHPCISGILSPGRTSKDHLNTIFPCSAMDEANMQPLCPFIQLPPSINQPARLNVEFVKPTSAWTTPIRGVATPSYSWRHIAESENPVWGWIIINYVDTALQMYTGEGLFVCEYRFGGKTGVNVGPRWLPFKPPKNPSDMIPPKLHQLLQKMASKDGPIFNQALWDVIDAATQSSAYTPYEYSIGSTAIIGKPLALVDVGVSLELSHAPHEAQYSNGPTLKEDEATTLYNYKFEYKLGDTERPYDGVVGYFDLKNDSTAVDFHKLYGPASTVSKRGSGDSHIELVDMNDPMHFETVSPYWIDCSGDFTSRSFTQQHDDRFYKKVRSMIVDPYAALHVYTGVLPTVSIKIPSARTQEILSKMTAFYTAGPIALPQDVPAVYDPILEVDTIAWLDRAKALAASQEEPRVRMPFKTIKGDWIWMQPYEADKEDGTDSKPRPIWEWRHYDAFEVGTESTAFAELTAPPTVVEGYLQLARPLAQ